MVKVGLLQKHLHRHGQERTAKGYMSDGGATLRIVPLDRLRLRYK